MAPSAQSCPICRKPSTPASRQFPFCSERCRTQDLANWATGEYAIPARATEADEQWELLTDTGSSERGRDD